jgi:uncharacterized protein
VATADAGGDGAKEGPVRAEDGAAAQPADAPDGAGPTAAGTGDQRRLAPEVVLVERIGGWIFAGVVASGALLALTLGWVLGWFPGWLDALLAAGWLALAGGLGWLAHAWPPLEYRHTRWRIGPLGLDIWSGVVWRSVVSVPRTRVQHIDVTQGPLQRRFGLATLSLHTAGTEHAKVSLSGLEHATALRVRDDLLVREEDDVV